MIAWARYQLKPKKRSCEDCEALGLKDDCRNCPARLVLELANRRAFEIWETLNACRKLFPAGVFSYQDLLTTTIARQGTDLDLPRVMEIETIYREYYVEPRKTGDSNHRNHKRA